MRGWLKGAVQVVSSALPSQNSFWPLRPGVLRNGVAVDWLAEEKLLWEREMARSKRYFEEAMRTGLLKVILPDRKARTDCLLARSRAIIAESHALLETATEVSAVLATLRNSANGKRFGGAFRFQLSTSDKWESTPPPALLRCAVMTAEPRLLSD
jgi:hypothetical protein